MELKKKEQTLRQLNRQLATSEGEKKSLQNNIFDAEKALRTVARYLTLYSVVCSLNTSSVDNCQEKRSSK